MRSAVEIAYLEDRAHLERLTMEETIQGYMSASKPEPGAAWA